MASKNQSNKQVKTKKRGGLLTFAIIIIGLHGAVGAYLYSTLTHAPDVQRPWIVAMMVIHFLANLVAAFGIYSWKKWGLTLYVASNLLAIVAGALAVGLFSIFYLILPLVITGYIVKSKLKYFS
jgi:hypothetical protein